MGLKCFFLDQTNQIQRSLRRYVSSGDGKPCPGPMSYHNASNPLDTIEEDIGPAERAPRRINQGDEWPWDDPRWPTHCVCGYQFTPDDQHQLFQERLYRRRDTGELVTLRDAAPGAMWYADWMPYEHRGPDGHCLAVKCPNGATWLIDSRASNCTLPDDNAHRCWVRHGEVPNITVDKNGLTCNAGAGSIQAGNWHGFLRNGELVT